MKSFLIKKNRFLILGSSVSTWLFLRFRNLAFFAMSCATILSLSLCTFLPWDLNTKVLTLAPPDGGEVPFTRKVRLLGSMMASSLKDDDEIEGRIRIVHGAFQFIRKQFFSAKAIKRKQRMKATLSVLLYGCGS